MNGIARAIWDLESLGDTGGSVILEGQFEDGDISPDGWMRSIDSNNNSMIWKKDAEKHGYCLQVTLSPNGTDNITTEGLYENNELKKDGNVSYDKENEIFAKKLD